MPPRTRTRARGRAASSRRVTRETTPVPPPAPIIENVLEEVGSTMNVVSDDDEDAFFVRNQNITLKEWDQIEQRAAKAQSPTKVKSRGLNHDDGDDDDDDGYRSSKGNSKKQPKIKAMPEWTRTGFVANFLSPDSDSDVELVGSSEATPKKVVTTPKGKRKRSRTRSITPPPPIPISELMETRERVRQALGVERTSPTAVSSPDEDLDDITELPPEFAEIAAKVKTNVASGSSEKPIISTTSEIQIKVRWNPHPEDKSGESFSRGFKMYRTDTFQDLFEDMADVVGVMTETLVLTHDGKRVFPASTPQAFGVWSEATLEAYSTYTFEYLRTHRMVRALSVDREASPKLEEAYGAFNYDAEASSQSESEANDDAFRITVRSGSNEISVKVRPQTTCGAIVASFIKRTSGKNGQPTVSAANAKAARIDFDGEMMDPGSCVADMELEEGDVIDIFGL